MKIEIHLDNRPLYSKYLTLKYNLIHFIFGSITEAEYEELNQTVNGDEEYKYRLHRIFGEE